MEQVGTKADPANKEYRFEKKGPIKQNQKGTNSRAHLFRAKRDPPEEKEESTQDLKALKVPLGRKEGGVNGVKRAWTAPPEKR